MIAAPRSVSARRPRLHDILAVTVISVFILALAVPAVHGPFICGGKRLRATIELLRAGLVRTRAQAIWIGGHGTLQVIPDEDGRLSERLQLSIAGPPGRAVGAHGEEWLLPFGIHIAAIHVCGVPNTDPGCLRESGQFGLCAGKYGIPLARFSADGGVLGVGTPGVRITDVASGTQLCYAIRQNAVGISLEPLY